jgi:hypothetical protein
MEVKNLKSFRTDPIDKDIAGKVLIDGINKLNLPYWVSAGTALGLYRDKDFIDGDTDVDIAMIGFEGIDNIIRESLGFEEIRNVYHEGKPQQLAFRSNDIIFDIYIHWQENNDYVNYGEMGKQRMPVYMYSNLKSITTKYGNLNFPSDPEEYFKIRYGDWQTPQSKKAHYEAI